MIVLILLLLYWVTITESKAAEEMGSVRIILTRGSEGTSNRAVTFGYKKVADIKNGTHILLEEYKESKINFKEIHTSEQLAEAAEKLCHYGKDTGRVKTNDDGVALIKTLEPGVYLIHMTDMGDYEPIVPFLVSVPTWSEETKEMQYDIEVFPKHTAVPKTRFREIVDTGDETNILLYVIGIISSSIFLWWYLIRRRNA